MSKNVKQWLSRHKNDHFVKSALVDGYRSRSAYKLEEIDKKFNILKHDSKCLDLGCFPGGWCQVISKKSSFVVGVDIDWMEPLNNVNFIQSDIYIPSTLDQIKQLSLKYSLITSDMASKFIGNKTADMHHSLQLSKFAFNISQLVLQRHGTFVVKIFSNPEFQLFRKDLESHFKHVYYFKPNASRNDSSEGYLVCLNK